MQPPRSRITCTASGMPASAEGRRPRLTLSATHGRRKDESWLSPSCLRMVAVVRMMMVVVVVVMVVVVMMMMVVVVVMMMATAAVMLV